MKKLILVFALIPSLLCADATLERATLRTFAGLAHQCASSARSTSDKASFENFKQVVSLYRENRKKFAKLDTLNENELSELHDSCVETLSTLQGTRRLPINHPIVQRTQSTDRLLDAIDLFIAQHDETLLKKTSTKRWLTRLALQTVVETGAAVGEHAYKKSIKNKRIKTTEGKKLTPEEKDKLAEPFTADEKMEILPASLGIASLRIGAHLIIDEYAPRGMSSYIQRFIELIVPVILAGAIMSCGTQKTKPLWFGMLRALQRFIMTRALLDKRHKLYKYFNSAAYIAPYIISMAKDGYNPRINLLDGTVNSLIFGLLPVGIDKALPRKIALNPAHRRKACKNLPRDIAAKLYQTLTDVARSA